MNDPAEDRIVIALLCQTLERTGFRTLNGEPFEEWARARVRDGDYPEADEEPAPNEALRRAVARPRRFVQEEKP